MIKKLFLTSLILGFIAELSAQSVNFFGIDMQSDWYTLTNISKLSYWVYGQENPGEQTICVNPRDDLSLAQFTSMGYDDVLLCFNTGVEDLHQLLPNLCLARHSYEISTFQSNGYRDYNTQLVKMKQIFGTPSENVVGTLASTTQWAFHDKQIVLTLDREDRTLSLICMPNR